MPHDNSNQSSRRQFLKSSTAATVSVGVLGVSSRAYAAGDDTIRVGRIGCGGRGTGAAAKAWSTEGNVKLVAMAYTFSDQLDKTVTVLVERRVKHPLYKKYIRRSTKVHAHDEENTCQVGDLISIEQCRPVSKSKSWRLHEIIERAR